MTKVTMRRATADDAIEVADVQITSFSATYDFPMVHTAEEVRGWVKDVLLPGTESWVAESGGMVVGFMSLTDEWLDQLYLRPGCTGQGIGSRLVALAQERRPNGLSLYTFQVNVGARRFYERHGFQAVELNDGSNNEEGQPDVRYAWGDARYDRTMNNDRS